MKTLFTMCFCGGFSSKQKFRVQDEADPIYRVTSKSLRARSLVERSPSINHADLRFFTLQELKQATSNFCEENLLGKGGFGDVFKGCLKAKGSTIPSVIAVKKLHRERLHEMGFRGQEQWLVEILMLTKFKHPNLVRLLGYYGDDNEAILVYDYFSEGSLHRHLFRPDGEPSKLTWQMRLKIVTHVARGIAYLHKEGVIHRDLKAANILLDKDYNAFLCDFGLAKEGPVGGNSHVSTAIMGTLGYLDPRYAQTGHLTKKSDVYSFGILVLELLTGKRAVSLNETGRQVSLVSWVMPFLAGRRPDYEKFVDPNLAEPFPDRVARKLSVIVKYSILDDPTVRPEMHHFVETLDSIDDGSVILN